MPASCGLFSFLRPKKMTMSLLPDPVQSFEDASGRPLSGGLLFTYAAGTLTAKATYQDAHGATPNANPITLNARGEAVVYGSGNYRLTLKDSAGTTIWDRDNVEALGLSQSHGSASIGFIQAGVSSVPRTAQAKMRDIEAVVDWGAIGDDMTDNTAPLNNARASNAIAFVPRGVFRTTTQAANLENSLYGPGQIRDGGGNKRGKWFNAVTAAPSAIGNEDDVATAFNGDWSRSHFAIEHRVTGEDTLGKPTTGYTYRPEAMPSYTFLYNESGWNESLSGNDGRTGIAAYRVRVYQNGQGDAACFNGSAFVTGTKQGSTSFLANPAAVLFNGDMHAGADGVYMNPYETVMDDGGFDVAAIGIVNNFKRTKATGAKSAIWNGYRAQNIGSASCDAIFSGVGKWVSGLDFAMSGLDFGAQKAAISLKRDDRIYFNNAALASGSLESDFRTTSFNGDYITYSSSISGLLFVVAGNPNLQVTGNQVTLNNSVLHSGNSIGFFGATPTTKPAVSGSRGGNGALKGVLAALASLGLLTDNTTV
jgi:hypothetical protein